MNELDKTNIKPKLFEPFEPGTELHEDWTHITKTEHIRCELGYKKWTNRSRIASKNLENLQWTHYETKKKRFFQKISRILFQILFDEIIPIWKNWIKN